MKLHCRDLFKIYTFF